MSAPLRSGDVWLVDLDPVVGSEQAGQRPAVIVSGRCISRCLMRWSS